MKKLNVGLRIVSFLENLEHIIIIMLYDFSIFNMDNLYITEKLEEYQLSKKRYFPL